MGSLQRGANPKSDGSEVVCDTLPTHYPNTNDTLPDTLATHYPNTTDVVRYTSRLQSSEPKDRQSGLGGDLVATHYRFSALGSGEVVAR